MLNFEVVAGKFSSFVIRSSLLDIRYSISQENNIQHRTRNVEFRSGGCGSFLPSSFGVPCWIFDIQSARKANIEHRTGNVELRRVGWEVFFLRHSEFLVGHSIFNQPGKRISNTEQGMSNFEVAKTNPPAAAAQSLRSGMPSPRLSESPRDCQFAFEFWE